MANPLFDSPEAAQDHLELHRDDTYWNKPFARVVPSPRVPEKYTITVAKPKRPSEPDEDHRWMGW